MHFRASDLVDRLACENRIGLIFVDEYGHRRDYSFAEVATHSLRYAAVLRAFGVKERDRVYVCLSATAKSVFTLLALQRLGAIAILDEEQAAGAGAVIANRKYRPRIDDRRGHFSPEARYFSIGEECEGWARLDTLAQVAPAPAIVAERIDDAELEPLAQRAHVQLGALNTDVVWCATPIEGGLWFEDAIVRAWLCGSTAVSHDAPFEPRERLDLVRELEVTVLLQCCDEYRAELEIPEPSRFKLPRLRRCMAIDDACEESLRVKWLERFGLELIPYAAASPRPTDDPARL